MIIVSPLYILPDTNYFRTTQENVTKTTVSGASTDLAFALSLIGGVLITVGSVVGMGLAAIGRPFFRGMGGMMGYYGRGYPYMMGGYYYGTTGYYGVTHGLESVGIITGIL